MHVLLHLHQPSNTVFVQDVFLHETSEKLQVELDHFEVYQP